jgi:hypothetical protein
MRAKGGSGKQLKCLVFLPIPMIGSTTTGPRQPDRPRQTMNRPIGVGQGAPSHAPPFPSEFIQTVPTRSRPKGNRPIAESDRTVTSVRVRHTPRVSAVQAALQELLERTGASRVTLRQDVPGAYAFPVVEEALASGVGSLRDEHSVHLPTQPVVLEIQKGNQVVQHDSKAAFADPDYQRMLEVYGGMRAQIVTPIVVDGTVRAIVSLHQLGAPRGWTEAEIALATDTAARVKDLL